MLKTLFQGYAPTIAVAGIGYCFTALSPLVWLAFVWIFGAIVTVALAYIRSTDVLTPKVRTGLAEVPTGWVDGATFTPQTSIR